MPPVRLMTLSALEDARLLLTDKQQTAQRSLRQDSTQSRQCLRPDQAEQLQMAEADFPVINTYNKSFPRRTKLTSTKQQKK